MSEAEVNLELMTAKQLAKEYKLCAKEVKSKDISVRQVALKKFGNSKYFLEGGLLVPFLETVVPKKVCKLL